MARSPGGVFLRVCSKRFPDSPVWPLRTSAPPHAPWAGSAPRSPSSLISGTQNVSLAPFFRPATASLPSSFQRCWDNVCRARIPPSLHLPAELYGHTGNRETGQGVHRHCLPHHQSGSHCQPRPGQAGLERNRRTWILSEYPGAGPGFRAQQDFRPHHFRNYQPLLSGDCSGLRIHRSPAPLRDPSHLDRK